MISSIIDLKNFSDERGSLVAIEGNKDMPFTIKRIYYIFDNKSNLRRGFHAHKKLKQVLICVKGSCYIHLDNGKENEEVLLDNPTKGLFIDSTVWREMYDFSLDAVLLVLASERFEEEDYIRDYQKFIEYVNMKKG